MKSVIFIQEYDFVRMDKSFKIYLVFIILRERCQVTFHNKYTVFANSPSTFKMNFCCIQEKVINCQTKTVMVREILDIQEYSIKKYDAYTFILMSNI